MSKDKSSAIYRERLNRTIKRYNRELQMGEQIDRVATVPFLVSNGHLEALVWEYYALHLDWMADWHDNGSVRAEEIKNAMHTILAKHGEELKQYLLPYKGTGANGTTEVHRVYLAEKLFVD